MRRFILASALLVATACSTDLAVAQNAPTSEPGVFIQPAPAPARLYPSEGTLSFERTRLDYAPQSIGIENCVNLPISNTTDHPRLLTGLRTLDPKHFYISSPATAMLPLTVGANSTLYINVCFKADEKREYDSKLLAIFQSDTVILGLTGRGVPAPAVQPIPKETAIETVKQKGKTWIFGLGVSRRGVVRLNLEDAMGKTVRTFPFDDVKVPGMYEVTFDQKSDAGTKLDKGTYYLRMEVVDLDSKQVTHCTRTITIK